MWRNLRVAAAARWFILFKKFRHKLQFIEKSIRYILSVITRNLFSKSMKWKLFRWIMYLFQDESRSVCTQTNVSITAHEIENAIQQSKNNEAPSADNITSDILKLISPDSINILVQLFNSIYDSGLLTDWLKSTFIPIPKRAMLNHVLIID